jgi:hypothetical protein
VYRQLGTEERLFWSYAQLRPVHFTLTANIIGSLHLEGLRQALAQALAKVQHRQSVQIGQLQQTAMQFLKSGIS